MQEKTLEQLVAWTKTDEGKPARGLVGHIREVKDSRECWGWLQGLLTDKGNTVVDVGNLIIKEKPFCDAYTSAVSFASAMGAIRTKFLGVTVTKADTLALIKKRSTQAQPTVDVSAIRAAPVSQPKPQVATKPVPHAIGHLKKNRVIAAIDMGLSSKTTLAVIAEILEQN